MKMNCIDCGKPISTADGNPSIRDRCIPCGAAAGSPFLEEDLWKDYSAGMAKLSSAKVNLLLGLHSEGQGDVYARLDAIAMIDRRMLEVSDEYKAWRESL